MKNLVLNCKLMGGGVLDLELRLLHLVSPLSNDEPSLRLRMMWADSRNARRNIKADIRIITLETRR